MLATIPVLYAGVLFVLIWRAQCRGNWRLAWLRASIAWGVTLVAITEVLSKFGLITATGLAISWVIALALAVAWCWRLGLWHDWPSHRPRLPAGLFLGLGVPLVLIGLVTLVIAGLGWPNNNDSMSYHLARVQHWKQNASVEFYPTHILRQVAFPPFAEYAMLHFTLLGGDERWANLVQWTSMVGSLAGVSLLASLLGASPRGQAYAALACATLPMGILQASSTQNDYVVAYWLVCFTTLLVERIGHKATTVDLVLIGAALGLAVLTKATAGLYAPPLALLYLLHRPRRLVELVRPVLVIGFIAITIVGPFAGRNLDAFSSSLGPFRLPGGLPPPRITNSLSPSTSVRSGVFNEATSPTRFASSVIRNVGLHLGTPLPGLNTRIERAVKDWHKLVGLRVNDPLTSWRERRFLAPGIQPDENFAGNFPQLAMLGVSLAMIVCLPRLRGDRALLALSLALIGGFLIFCALLKFQIVGSRLHLPLFVLWTPVIGRVFDRWSSQLLLVVAFILSAWSVPYLLENRSHPVLGNETIFNTSQVDQMFRGRLSRQRDYTEAAALLQQLGCSRIGFISNLGAPEYQFWQLLPALKDGGGQFEHVAVTGSTAGLTARWPPFLPCAVIDVRDSSSDSLDVLGQRFELAREVGDVRVLLPRSP